MDFEQACPSDGELPDAYGFPPSVEVNWNELFSSQDEIDCDSLQQDGPTFSSDKSAFPELDLAPHSFEENQQYPAMKNYFHAPRLLDNEHVKLEKIFSALNLGRIAGIEIQFTNNLADHLRLMGEDDKKVWIFHNASFLRVQRNK